LSLVALSLSVVASIRDLPVRALPCPIKCLPGF
jgi:hypothetical protein